MNREAGLKEVIEKITKNIYDKSYAKALIDKVTNFVTTHNKNYDLSNQEAGQIYKNIDYSKQIKLNNGKTVDIDWTNHSEYRSDLRDIKPDRVNDALRKEFNQKVNQDDLIGREPIKKPGVGTMVVDYNLRDGEAALITVWASKPVEGKYLKIANKLTSEICDKNL